LLFSLPAKYGILLATSWMFSCLSLIIGPEMDFMQRIPALVWCLLSSLLLWLSFFPVNAGWLGKHRF